MKKLLFLSVILLSFSACTKTLSVSKTDLVGAWSLRNISGGFIGIDSTPADHITLTFTSAGLYTSSKNSNTTASGNYTLTKAGDPNYYGSPTLINLITKGNQTTYGIILKNDSLYLSEPCCDQFGYTYIRE